MIRNWLLEGKLPTVQVYETHGSRDWGIVSNWCCMFQTKKTVDSFTTAVTYMQSYIDIYYRGDEHACIAISDFEILHELT